MQKRIKIHKGIGSLIMTGAVLVLLTGCSTTQSLLGWLPFSDYSKIEPGISKKDIRDFGVSIRPARGNADAHYLLAKYYQERGRHKDAIVELEKTIWINSAHVKAYNRMGISYDRLGDFPRAVLSYRNALVLNPELDYVLNNLGYSYILQGKYDKAVEMLTKAVAINKSEERYQNNLALAYARHEKYDKTVDAFSVAGKRDADNYNFTRMLTESNFARETEKIFSQNGSYEGFLGTVNTRSDAKKALYEAQQYRTSRKIIASLKNRKKIVFGKPIFGSDVQAKRQRLAFGKPIFGPGLRQEKPKIVFGKPIYGPGFRQEKPKIVFGKPIYGPEKQRLAFGKPIYGHDLQSTKEGLTSGRQTFSPSEKTVSGI